MNWNDGPLVAYDCETTGINIESDRIVTAALIDPNDQNVTWLADPGIDIPTAASDIHHVTTAHARKHGQKARTVVEEISEALAESITQGAALVVMNAPYDLSLLDRECTRHHLPTLEQLLGHPVGPVIDPLVLDRAADKYRKGKRTLEALCGHYDVKLDDAHTADADATAGLDVALRIAERKPELQVPAWVLHGWQATWHERWAAGYEEYLRRSRPDAVISRSWPLVPAPIEEVSA
jgi:DNA polymerase-3 subunit epsilon